MKKSDLKKIIREVIAEAMSGPTKGPMSGMKGKKPMMSTRDGNTGRGGTSKLGGGKHYRHPSKGPGHNPNIDGGDNTDTTDQFGCAPAWEENWGPCYNYQTGQQIGCCDTMCCASTALFMGSNCYSQGQNTMYMHGWC